MAATVGVLLYACGGTIPLLQQWLADGMSMGSASAFMITGPSTKITNLGALKIVLGIKHFALYIIFVILSALISGVIVNLLYKYHKNRTFAIQLCKGCQAKYYFPSWLIYKEYF